jgi:hypothetical protein
MKVFGTSQPGRLAPAFDPGSAPIDDRSEEELLAFAPRLAALFNYRDGENKTAGTFDPFFRADPRISLALIASTPAALEAEELKTIAGQIQDPPKRSASSNGAEANAYARFHDLLVRLYALCARVNGWQSGFPKQPAASAFSATLTTIIAQEMAPALAEVRSYWKAAQALPLPGFAGFPREPVDWAAFDATLWQLGRPLPPFSFRFTDPVPLSAVFPAYHTLVYWESRIAASARRELLQFPQAPQDLPPQTSLYAGFLSAFTQAQQQLNGLTARHLDFYYGTILQQAKRGAVPDKALACFVLDPKASSAFLPAGTQLSAGKDAAGNALVYATVADFQANSLRLGQIATLWVGPVQGASLGVYVSPVANSADGAGPAFQDAARSWPSFGEDQSAYTPEERTMQDGRIGFAVSAPIFEMAEGLRTLTLRFTVADLETGHPADLPPPAFQAQLSGSAGWIAAPVQAVPGTPNTYQLTLKPEDPPVVAFNPAVLDGAYDSRWPVLRFLLDPGQGAYAPSPFKNLKLQGLAVTAQAGGIKTLDLFNGSGRLAAGKPFQPFGAAPPCGSTLYIGCAEAFRKPLSSLTLHFTWFDLPNPPQYPGGFASYYQGYIPPSASTVVPSIVLNNTAFQSEAAYLSAGSWQPFQNLGPVLPPPAGSPAPPSSPALPLGHFYLFNLNPDQSLAASSVYQLQSSGAGPINGADPSLPPAPLALDSKTLGGFLSFKLDQPSCGFGQNLYPQAVSRIALENAEVLIKKFQPKEPPKQQAEALAEEAAEDLGKDAGSLLGRFWNWVTGKKKKAAPPPAPAPPPAADPEPPQLQPLPNPPFSPTLTGLSLDYTASASLDFTANTQQAPYRFYQISPFASYEATKPSPELLPQLNTGGYLFLGFTPQDLPLSVSVLFQIQERTGGCAQGAVSADSAIHWSYLSRDAWTAFDPQSVGDQTEFLKKSGLITFSIPAGATASNETMPDGLLWICGGVQDPEAFSRLVALYPQATACQWVPEGDAGVHLEQPLPAGSLQNLLTPMPEIKKVLQPLPSSGGRPPEDTAAFHGRVSERLRHKQRAWQSWDYERLVLQEFPEIFCAKCLPLTAPDPSSGGYRSPVAGSVLVLALPRFFVPPAESSYPPGLTQSQLEEIREFLAAHASPFASIAVANPAYRQIQVSTHVQFKSGIDPVKGSAQINDALRGYLSPWIFQPGEASAVAEEFTASGLFQFTQSLPCVETVFSLGASPLDPSPAPEPGASGDGEDALVFRPGPPWAVLVSAWSHLINPPATP